MKLGMGHGSHGCDGFKRIFLLQISLLLYKVWFIVLLLMETQAIALIEAEILVSRRSAHKIEADSRIKLRSICLYNLLIYIVFCSTCYKL
jgi:hypothetical protein